MAILFTNQPNSLIYMLRSLYRISYQPKCPSWHSEFSSSVLVTLQPSTYLLSLSRMKWLLNNTSQQIAPHTTTKQSSISLSSLLVSIYRTLHFYLHSLKNHGLQLLLHPSISHTQHLQRYFLAASSVSRYSIFSFIQHIHCQRQLTLMKWLLNNTSQQIANDFRTQQLNNHQYHYLLF